MNRKITTTTLIALAGTFAAFAQEHKEPLVGPEAPAMSAQEQARAEMRADPTKTIPLFVDAARNMKMAIDDDASVIEELKIDESHLAHLPPEEQFMILVNAIKTVPQTPAQKRSAVEKVFGAQNAEIVDYILADSARVDYAASQLRAAHVLFNEYERPTDVDNWGWGNAWGIDANLTVGTLGIGLDIGYEINKYWKIRGHYGRGSITTSMKIHDARINLGWENNDNAGLLVDWHPKGSQFHVTAGLMYSNPKVKLWGTYDATANSIDMETPEGGTYPYPLPAGYRVESNYKMDGKWNNEVQPYLGFGWSSDGGKDRTLYFTLDVGLLYVGGSSYAEHGTYNMYFDSPYGEVLIATGNRHGATQTSNFDDSRDPLAAAALQRMDGNIRNFIDKVAGFLDDMYVYPVIQFGGGIRF